MVVTFRFGFGVVLIALFLGIGFESASACQLDIDDYSEGISRAKTLVGDEGFHFVVERPFIVAGDESPDIVERRAAGTVRWAVRHLKQLYFTEDPGELITIWLFKDAASYNGHCESLFGIKPTTPYGFYSAQFNALIMNIETGGGTLVHEIVHPFIAANFPECPSWFNEGLASLYEQSEERGGEIRGLTNWRLRALQACIVDETIRPFPELLKTSTREFYGDASGANYAQARYLCYYLQQNGKLVSFYHRFRESYRDDPSGIETLKSVLEITDWEEFQRGWEQFVSELRYK